MSIQASSEHHPVDMSTTVRKSAKQKQKQKCRWNISLPVWLCFSLSVG